MCVYVCLCTHYTVVGVLGKDVCGCSERRRGLCDIQIETAVFLQCVYVCETLLQSVKSRNSYKASCLQMCQRGNLLPSPASLTTLSYNHLQKTL